MRYLFSIIMLLGSMSINAQDCRVILENYEALSYSGECKKGLAHGEGKAVFEGFLYEGKFKKGIPDKEGVLVKQDTIVLKVEIEDGLVYGKGSLFYADSLVKEGYWKGTLNDYRFVGADEEGLLGYKILQEDNLGQAQISFSKNENNSNYLTIMLSDPSNRSISNVNVNERTSGQIVQNNLTASRVQVEINNLQFPYVMSLTYRVAANQGVNSEVFVVYRFQIDEPGDWILRINH